MATVTVFECEVNVSERKAGEPSPEIRELQNFCHETPHSRLFLRFGKHQSIVSGGERTFNSGRARRQAMAISRKSADFYLRYRYTGWPGISKDGRMTYLNYVLKSLHRGVPYQVQPRPLFSSCILLQTVHEIARQNHFISPPIFLFRVRGPSDLLKTMFCNSPPICSPGHVIRNTCAWDTILQ